MGINSDKITFQETFQEHKEAGFKRRYIGPGQKGNYVWGNDGDLFAGVVIYDYVVVKNRKYFGFMECEYNL